MRSTTIAELDQYYRFAIEETTELVEAIRQSLLTYGKS